MALTRDFKKTVQKRVDSDPEFAKALFREALDLMLDGDAETSRLILRDICKTARAKDERQRLKERIAELEAAIDEIAGYATIETPADVTEIINQTRRNGNGSAMV